MSSITVWGDADLIQECTLYGLSDMDLPKAIWSFNADFGIACRADSFSRRYSVLHNEHRAKRTSISRTPSIASEKGFNGSSKFSTIAELRHCPAELLEVQASNCVGNFFKSKGRMCGTTYYPAA